MMTNLKDSGTREKFGDGAVRDGEVGKGRYDLLSPLATHRLSLWMEAGGIKYDDRNWEAGMPLSQYIDSAIRHLKKFECGLEDEDHLAACLWNIHCLTHTKIAIEQGLLSKGYDDLPYYFKDKQEAGLKFFESRKWIQDLKEKKDAEKHKKDTDLLLGSVGAKKGLAEDCEIDEALWKALLIAHCSTCHKLMTGAKKVIVPAKDREWFTSYSKNFVRSCGVGTAYEVHCGCGAVKVFTVGDIRDLSDKYDEKVEK